MIRIDNLATISRSRQSQRSPAVDTVVRRVLGDVEKGTLRAGDKLPSIRELSQQHGVSFAHARVALAHLEKLGLAERMHGSGTYLREMNDDDTSRVATNIVYTFFDGRAHILGNLGHDLTALLHEQGMLPISMSWEPGEAQAMRLIGRQWRRDPPQAIVLHAMFQDRDAMVREIAPPGTRIIKVCCPPQFADPSWHSVNPDHFNAFRIAVEYLLKQGHKRIGLVLKPRVLRHDWAHAQRKSLMQHSQQILGAGQATRDAGLHDAITLHYNREQHNDPSCVPVDAANIADMRKWLTESNRPTAVVCDDFRMLGVRLAAIAAGLRVPDDLTIVPVGGTFLAEAGESVGVSLQYQEIASHTARLVAADESELATAACHVVVPPVLVKVKA